MEPVCGCCPLCGKPFTVAANAHLCSRCHGGRRPYLWCRGLYLYTGAMARALAALKFGRRLALLAPLRRRLMDGWEGLEPKPEVELVVPVPASWFRKWERGFNQASLLAEPLARALEVPLLETALGRRGSRTQVGLGRADRERNAARSFLPGKGIGKVAGRRVLLFDDVYTTGATVQACSRLLSRQGASVTVLTLARRAPDNLEHLVVDAAVGGEDT
ncbi:MAG: ComF family protein [bacterium]|nr:MAG: ComF family protein [bacterium]